jgi:hypothetical protein
MTYISAVVKYHKNRLSFWSCNMHWFVGYLVVCWLLGFITVRGLFQCLVSTVDQSAECRERFLVSRVLWGASLLFTAPLWLPWLLLRIGIRFAGCLKTAWQIRGIAEQYREPVFDPIDERQIGMSASELFGDQTPVFIEWGFQQLSDYQTKPEPVPVYNRYFLGVNGTVFGAVTSVLGSSGPSLFSILSDGTYVETAGTDPCDWGESIVDSDLLHVVCGGACLVDKLLGLHLEALCQEADRRRATILSFEADQLDQVAIYGQRRFWSWRQRMGDNTGPIPECVLPDGVSATVAEVRHHLPATSGPACELARV